MLKNSPYKPQPADPCSLHSIRRRLHHPSRLPLRSAPSFSVLQGSVNGLGGVFFGVDGTRLAFRTEVPKSFLQIAVTTKAYIYWLEALAQPLSLAVIANVLSDMVVCFVDNVASEHALRKERLFQGHTTD